jgi:hypothetical protein
MTITIDMDTAFANAQRMAQLIQDDPNPHRTMYVRLIGELEAVILLGHRSGGKSAQKAIESQLATLIRRQREEIAKREEDAEVRRRLEAYSE